MINTLVFRSPEDYQYAVICSETFERCKGKIITRQDIESRRLTAQLDHFENALHWHSQYVDSLWRVSQVQSFEYGYRNSDFIGFWMVEVFLENYLKLMLNSKEKEMS